ncbi:MAG: DUF4810 domain-containing protein [Desulfobulbus sp.]|uniref:DUF4810 domain-containing protein n=1 Tax=uncultured Desulfobulbus sp. TaxID=239745 RepID=UPI001B64231A|nr:DUF4810 domain-containing protein [uncultured Desulfobulbus sp.]MBP7517154.1 DUF4810 domain-containing protein [Desulfobulbus sp.]
MPAFARRFVVVLAAVLLVGCGPEPRPLYTWGDYQPTVYQYYQNEQGGLEEQIAALEKILEQARADNRPVPPGLHAHLGLLFARGGDGVAARGHFLEEKALYPEAGPYMDFLLRSKEAAR